VDVHVIEGSTAFGWVPEGASQAEVKAILEALFPRLLWSDFNEIFGGLGQLMGKKENELQIKQVLEQAPFNTAVSANMTAWMERRKLKSRNKKRQTSSPDTKKQKKPTTEGLADLD
jgi:hypothetical protein